MVDDLNNAVIGDSAATIAAPAARDITFGDSQTQMAQFTNAGKADSVGGINPAQFASQLIGDPSAFFNDDMKLGGQIPNIDAKADGTNIDGSAGKYDIDPSSLSVNAATGQTSQASMVAPQQTATYVAETSLDRITQPANTMDAAQGQVRDDAIINEKGLDLQGAATGTNADGSKSYVGEALGKSASQGIASVVDTSTVAGKLLAQSLGEGNYTDAKSTVKGQLDILSKEFVDPTTGEPRIPTWAAGAARAVSRIAAFKGVTGTAATAAMAQAIMEATLPIAQQDAQFFQTVTLKNLDNKQQSIINTANILSKMELANLDTRMQTAVENAKNFMQMDLTNLNNEQQASAINTQARVQSILEDSKQENSARLFGAQSSNETNKFYDNLRSSIDMYNSTQKNSMEQFNSGQINDVSQFNSQLENTREQFYKNMQYNIDTANAKWRQTVTTSNAQMQFEAAATDVKNMVGVSVEQLNQIWDRSDSLLDYAFKASDNEAERQSRVAIAKMNAEIERQKVKQESGSALGKLVGGALSTVAGSFLGPIGKAVGSKLAASIF